MRKMTGAILLCVFFLAMLFLAFMLGMIWEDGTKVDRRLGVAILVINAISFCFNIFTLC